MYDKILVTLENSATDAAILDHVENLARQFGSKLLLVHVADGWAARYRDQLSLAESEEIREDRNYLEMVRSALLARGIAAEAELLFGDPANEIIHIAAERNVDLVAMSTHGHRFLGDLIHGSTATKVRHLVSVPVLLVPARRRRRM